MSPRVDSKLVPSSKRHRVSRDFIPGYRFNANERIKFSPGMKLDNHSREKLFRFILIILNTGGI